MTHPGSASTRGELLATSRSILELLIARVSDDAEYAYIKDVGAAWEREIDFAAQLSPSFAVPPLAAKAFDQLVAGMLRLAVDQIPEWMDLFPRNVLDLVQVQPIAVRTAAVAPAKPIEATSQPVLKQDWVGLVRRRQDLARAA